MDVRLFWAKTGEDLRWHPALYHMIDVGQVAGVPLRHATCCPDECLAINLTGN